MWWLIAIGAFLVWEHGEKDKAENQRLQQQQNLEEMARDNAQPWKPVAYARGSYVTYQGKTWKADTMTLSTDRPGGTSHWVELW